MKLKNVMEDWGRNIEYYPFTCQQEYFCFRAIQNVPASRGDKSLESKDNEKESESDDRN